MSYVTLEPAGCATTIQSSVKPSLNHLKQALLDALGLEPVSASKNEQTNPHKVGGEPNTRAVEYVLSCLTARGKNEPPSKFQQFIDALYPLIRDLVDELNQLISKESKLADKGIRILIVPSTSLETQMARALGLAEDEDRYFYALREDVRPAALSQESAQKPSNRDDMKTRYRCILMDVERICNKFLSSDNARNSINANARNPSGFAETLLTELTAVIREIYLETSDSQQTNDVRGPLNVGIENEVTKAFTGALIKVEQIVAGNCFALSLDKTCTNKVSQWRYFDELEKDFSQLLEKLWETIITASASKQKCEKGLKEVLAPHLSNLGLKLKPQVTDDGLVIIKVKDKTRKVALETYIEYLQNIALQEIRKLRQISPIKEGEDTNFTIAYFALMVSGGYMTHEVFKKVAETVFQRKNSQDLDYAELHRSLRRVTLACTQLGMLGDEAMLGEKANSRLRGIQNVFLGEIGALYPLFSFLSNLGGFATPDGVELLNSLLKETVTYIVATKIFQSRGNGIKQKKTPLEAFAREAPQFEDFVEQVKKLVVTSRKGLFSLCWKILRKALSKGVPLKTSLSQVGDVKVADIVRIGFVGLTKEDVDLVKQILYVSGARHSDPTNPDGQTLVALGLSEEQEVLCEVMFKPDTENKVMFKPNTENGANEIDGGDNDNNSRLPHDIYDIYKGVELAKNLAAAVGEAA